MIEITDRALAYIKKWLAKENGIAFRLSIKKTGCSGYSYVPSISLDERKQDTALVIKELPILLDTTWLHVLQHVHIDYVEEEKSGLKQKRLVITNPEEASRCGCGESFHLE
jgi:iron-sulfur cluster assembly protein